MLIDYHLHNHFSSDSESKTFDVVKKAADLGIQEICFCNHVETFAPEGGPGSFTYQEARERFTKDREEISEVQKLFPNLPIRFGIELEYKPEWMEEMARFVEDMSFDFRIGSVHEVDGIIVASSKLAGGLYEKVEEEYAYNKYFDLLYEMVSWGHFDVVGHFDVNKKGALPCYGPFKPQKYKKKIVKVLKLMKEKGIGLELNTSAIHRYCKEIFPHPDILKWALETGIENFTLGSDAHKAEEVGQNFEKALKIAKEVGITQLSAYEKRKPKRHTIT